MPGATANGCASNRRAGACAGPTRGSCCPLCCPWPCLSSPGESKAPPKAGLCRNFREADARTRTGDPIITSSGLLLRWVSAYLKKCRFGPFEVLPGSVGLGGLCCPVVAPGDLPLQPRGARSLRQQCGLLQNRWQAGPHQPAVAAPAGLARSKRLHLGDSVAQGSHVHTREPTEQRDGVLLGEADPFPASAGSSPTCPPAAV